MPVITGLKLKNFRVFKEETSFEFAPITVLTGANNSGKSSVLKALLLMDDNTKRNGNLFLDFSGELHKLGSFELARNNQTSEDEPIGIGYTMDTKLLWQASRGFCYFDNPAWSEREGIAFLQEKNKYDSFLASRTASLNFEFSRKTNKKNIHQSNILLSIEGKENCSTNLHGYDLEYPTDTKHPYLAINFKSFLASYFECVEKHKAEVERYKIHSEKINKEINEQISHFTKEEPKSTMMRIIGSINAKYQNEYVGEDKAHLELSNFEDYSFVNKEFKLLIQSHFLSQIAPHLVDDFFSTFEEIVISEIDLRNQAGLVGYNNAPKEIKNYNLLNQQKYQSIIEVIGDFLIGGTDTLIKSIDENGVVRYYTDIESPFAKAISKAFSEWQSELRETLSTYKIEYIEPVRINQQRLYTYQSQGTNFNKTLHEFVSWETESEYRTFFKKWIGKDGFDFADDIEIKEIEGVGYVIKITKNDKKIDLSDLGFGISQILSIVMRICMQAPPSDEYGKVDELTNIPLMLLEEPEINLHPNFQALLADMLIDAQKMFGLRFIVETHSEYFIRRLQVLTADKTLKPEDTALYYFYTPGKVPPGREQVERIRIEPNGALDKPFGEGFYDMSNNLAVALYKINHNLN